jgi:hypothetical protein
MPQHSRDPSTSEDDSNTGTLIPGLYSSPADDQVKTVPLSRKHFPEGSEIQYLDLDLDSDSNSNPRTPNAVETISNKSGGSSVGGTMGKESVHVVVAASSPGHSSASTVYKTVDFVKTEALNKLRLNQEAHRSNP